MKRFENPAVLRRDEQLPGRHGPIPVRRYGPPDSNIPPLIWLHGGAFSRGGLDQPECFGPALAIAGTGRPVVTVDYRLVPQWNPVRRPKPPMGGIRYPIPLDDVMDVIAHLAAETSSYFVGGASAGAALAASAVKRLHAEGSPGPVGLLLAYGIFHSTLPPLSDELRRATGGKHALLQFRPKTVESMNLNYLGSAELFDDPIAFPGGHDGLNGFPPTLMIDAEHDTLRGSGSRFGEELRSSGVDVTYLIVAGSTHGFLNRPTSPFFNQGIGRMLAFLDESDTADDRRTRDRVSGPRPRLHNTPGTSRTDHDEQD